jgi:hypothetical protein
MTTDVPIRCPQRGPARITERFRATDRLPGPRL